MWKLQTSTEEGITEKCGETENKSGGFNEIGYATSWKVCALTCILCIPPSPLNTKMTIQMVQMGSFIWNGLFRSGHPLVQRVRVYQARGRGAGTHEQVLKMWTFKPWWRQCPMEVAVREDVANLPSVGCIRGDMVNAVVSRIWSEKHAVHVSPTLQRYLGIATQDGTTKLFGLGQNCCTFSATLSQFHCLGTEACQSRSDSCPWPTLTIKPCLGCWGLPPPSLSSPIANPPLFLPTQKERTLTNV